MIRIGIGGWQYEPWRGAFYPAGLAQTKELGYASRQVTTIEVNGTFYSTQKPSSFRKWADETPDDFMFSLKAPRYAVNRRILAEAAPSIEKFIASGISALGAKLGPILWQFAPTKRFDPDDFAAFLALLPPDADGVALRHALEVRHDSFIDPAFIALARKHKAAIVFADSDTYPAIADLTGSFVYARLQRAEESIETGYDAPALDRWAQIADAWAKGDQPADLPVIGQTAQRPKRRDVFIYMINGAKVRAAKAAARVAAKAGVVKEPDAGAPAVAKAKNAEGPRPGPNKIGKRVCSNL